MPNTMNIESILAQIAAKIVSHTPAPGKHLTLIEGFYLVRREEAEELRQIYTPFIGLMAQGGKRTLVGADEYRYGPGHCFVAGVDVPSVSTIIGANPDAPFLALALELDRELVMRLSAAGRAVSGIPRGVAVMPAEPKVALAFLRLLELLDEPEDIPVMAPLLIREIHHRLLLGPQGDWLVAVCAGAAGSRVAEAAGWLRANYTSRFSVTELAKNVGMSESAFFRAFRELTTLSPLQFQKTLRLYEARRLLSLRQTNVENAAFAVGYESASQFVRDYKRLFGEPPKRDVMRMRGRA